MDALPVIAVQTVLKLLILKTEVYHFAKDIGMAVQLHMENMQRIASASKVIVNIMMAGLLVAVHVNMMIQNNKYIDISKIIVI